MVLGLHCRLDRDRQEELVRTMLHLISKLLQFESNTIFNQQGSVRVRKREELQKKREDMMATSDSIHSIVKEVGKMSPAKLSKFKCHLMEQLTTESSMSPHAANQVSELLVIQIEPSPCSEAIVDSTELLILLQSASSGPKDSKGKKENLYCV
jgi:hypothetical protein